MVILRTPEKRHPSYRLLRKFLQLTVLLGTMIGCDDNASRVEPTLAAAHTDPGDARSAWLRVNPEGLAALPALLFQVGSPQSVPLPSSSSGDLRICPEGGCTASITLEQVALSARAGGIVQATARMRARTGPIGVRYEQSWACAFTGYPECSVVVNSANHPPNTLSLSSEINVLGEEGALTRFGLNMDANNLIEGSDISISGANACGGIWCNVANVAGATSYIASEANGALSASLQGEAEALLCRACSSGCPGGSRCERGICQTESGCVPSPVAFESYLPDPDTPKGALVSLALADHGDTRLGGLDLAMRITATPVSRSVCVPSTEPPSSEALPVSVLSRTAERGHFRVAVGEAAINRALWAVYASGEACLDFPVDDLPDLANRLLRTLVPGLSGLPEPHNPELSIRPLSAPVVRFEVEEMVVEAAVQVDLFVRVADQPIRIVSGRVRLTARVGLDVDGRSFVLRVPQSERSAVVESVWVSPLAGTDIASLERGLEPLLQFGVGLAEERIVLGELPPGSPAHVALAQPPRMVTVGDHRALLLDMNLVEP